MFLPLLGASPGLAHAWQGDDPFFETLPVYLSVTRLPQNITEMPAAITIIDRSMIEASGAIEITDLLRLVPGFQVAHYHGTEGPRAVVRSHGFSDQFSRRMQVLVDGISVYKNSTGGPEWYDLPLMLDDIERIEVIRGPNASTYGSNSVIAVVNIITRETSSQQGSRVHTVLGERNYQQYSFRHGEQHNNLSFRVSGDYIDSAGLVSMPDKKDLNDDMHTRRINLRTDYRAGVNDYLTVSLAGGDGKRQVGHAGQEDDPIRDIDMRNSHHSVTWRQIKDTDSEIVLNLSSQQHQLDNVIRQYPDSTNFPTIYAVIDQSLKSERDSMEFTHRLRLGEASRLVWGVEAREDRVSGVSYFDHGNSYKMQSRNAYFNLEWRPVQEWIVNLGNMREDYDLYGVYNSPRLAINRLFGGGYYARAVAGRAYRMPMFLEEKGDFSLSVFDGGVLLDRAALDNAGFCGVLSGILCDRLYYSFGDLKAEKQDSVELAFGHESTSLGYDIRLFRNHLENNIYIAENKALIPRPDHIRNSFVNNDPVTTHGLEASLRLRASEDVRAYFNYSVAEAKGKIKGVYNLDGSGYTEYWDMSSTVPKNTFSMLLDVDMDRRRKIGIGYYYVSSLRFIDHREEHEARSITALDLTYRHGFQVAQMKGRWNVLLRDMGGPYFTGVNHIWRDRQGFIGVAMEF